MSAGATRELAKQMATFATLAGCTKEDLTALAEAGDEVLLPDAWTIVREGEAANGCYVLLEGTGAVFRGRTRIAAVGPGDIIGEMAYAQGDQRHATVTTTGKAKALRIEFPKLTELLDDRPRLKDAMSAAYRKHLAADAAAAERQG